MKYKYLLSVCLLGFVLITSCNKELEGEELDYVGYWEGDYTYLTIQLDGTGSYDYYDGFLSKNASGRVKVKGDKLKIGVKKFTVNVKPHESNGYWTMVLDGEEFERY